MWRHLLLSGAVSCVVGCADDHAAHRTSQGSSDAATVLDAAAVVRAEPATEPGPLCKTACAVARPANTSAPYPCTFATLSECEKQCRSALEDTDRSCGRCIADAISWPAASGGCNTRECYCTGGLPTFDTSRCKDACAATEARRAQTRLSATTPAPTGHRPQASAEFEQLRSIVCLSAHADGLWLAGGGLYGGGVAHVSAALSIDWTTPADAVPGSCISLLGTRDGDAILLSANAEHPVLERWSVRGERRYRVELGSLKAASAMVSPTPDSLLLIGPLAQRTMLAASDGAVRDGTTSPARFSGSVYAAAIDDANQRLALGGSSSTGALLAVYTGGVETAGFERVFGGDATSVVNDTAFDAQGYVVVGGSRYVQRTYGTGGGHISYGTPFVARVSPDGELLWRWEHETIIGGQVNGVATDAAGNVYSVGTEDPTTDPSLRFAVKPCSVYGCNGLVVRKFSAEGRLVWEYQHRNALSYGLAIGIDAQGRVLAAGSVRREDARGLLLRFSPD